MQGKEQKTVFLAAGGTGGHLFPAEALGRELMARGYSVHILTDSRARRFVATGAEGFALDKIHVLQSATIVSKNPLKLAKTFAKLLAGFWESAKLIRRCKPALIIGFGGYPTLPPLFAARFLHIPILLHEQNAVMGRANRLLADKARAVAMGFPPVAGQKNIYADKTVITGNPLRIAVLDAAAAPYRPAKANEQWTLLVFGGSQGASFFSEIMPQALALLPRAHLARLKLIQQARPADERALRAAYEKLGIKAEIAPFFRNLPALMAQAQFIIARAGASTVAEIAAIGRPSLLVPYPKALDADQKHNAEALAAAGGADVAEQADLAPEKLAALLNRAMELPQFLAQRAQAAAKAGNRDAVLKLADLAQNYLK